MLVQNISQCKLQWAYSRSDERHQILNRTFRSSSDKTLCSKRYFFLASNTLTWLRSTPNIAHRSPRDYFFPLRVVNSLQRYTVFHVGCVLHIGPMYSRGNCWSTGQKTLRKTTALTNVKIINGTGQVLDNSPMDRF